MGSLTIVTAAPDELPVDLDRFKSQARIDATTEDALLRAYLRAAIAYLDGPTGILGRALMTQTWYWRLDDWSEFQDMGGGIYGIEAPLPPLLSVTSISYIDVNNTTQTWASSNYQADIYSTPGRIALAPAVSLPSLYGNGKVNQVTIRFVAGYGASPTDVPEDIRLAITLIAAHWYERRLPYEIGAGQMHTIPMSADALLFKYRMKLFG